MDIESSFTSHASADAADARPATKDTAENHLGVLDGLRGMMSLWVLGGHVAACAGAQLPLLDHPGTAVDIFMFISGLLMAYHFRLREKKEPWHSPNTWWRFYLRRFFRIAPAYYVLLTAAYIFHSQLYGAFSAIVTTYRPPGFPLPIITPPLTWTDAFAHFTFLFGLIPQYVSDTCLADWSISLEMQFYLAFPFIMLLFRRISYLRAALLYMAIWAAANALIGVYGVPKLLGTFPQPSFLPLRLNCFVIGILVAEALYWRTLDWRTTTLLFLGALALSLKGTSFCFQLACIASSMLLLRTGPMMPGWGMSRIFYSSFFGRAVSFFADTSYGVYLAHPFVMLPMAAFLLRFPAYSHLPAPARFAVLMLSVSSLCYPLAFLLFRLVERPGIAFGRQLLRRFPRKQASCESRANLSPSRNNSAGY